MLPSVNSQNGFPFSAGLSRQMVVFGVSELRLAHGAVIDAIGFPRDDGTWTSTQSVDVRFRIGSAALPFVSAPTVFDANWHGVPSEVFALRTLALPALSPNLEVVWIPFDHPYGFDGSRDLVLESVVTATGTNGYPFDYRLEAFGAGPGSVAVGQPCPTSGGWTPGLSGFISPVTQRLEYGVNRSVADTGVAFLFALQPRATPLDLTGIGASGCSLYLDPLVTVTGRTRSDGVYWAPSADIGGLRSYTNLICLQAAIGDYFANPLGVITTVMLEIRFRVDPFAMHIVAQGSPNASSGASFLFWGGAVLFRH
ncbi:MAG: hypothetical protein HZB39_09415 [Planctomycetes bacterium]|nr:hypothetical protein [Planctomycetota bacterium]